MFKMFAYRTFDPRQCIIMIQILQYEVSELLEHKNVMNFLSISLNMCLGCSKEPSHRDGSFEYPQYMFWLRNKKFQFKLPTLIWMPGYKRIDAQSDLYLCC